MQSDINVYPGVPNIKARKLEDIYFGRSDLPAELVGSDRKEEVMGERVEFEARPEEGLMDVDGLLMVSIPENERMSPKKGPFQKERLVFQPLFFREHVSFPGCSIFLGVLFGIETLNWSDKYRQPVSLKCQKSAKVEMSQKDR